MALLERKDKLTRGLPRTLVLSLGLGFAMAGHGAVFITTLQEDVGGSDKPRKSEMVVDKDKLRLDIQGDRDMVLIYRKDKDAFWMVDAADKSYTEMTSKDLQELGDALAQARKKMEEQMQGLPPEQRAMMEKMMGGMMAAPAQPKVTFKKVQGKGKVGGWSCENWESFLDGVKSAEHCVADYKAVGVSADDFAVFKEMADFLGKLAPGYKGMLEQGMNLDQLGGIPVQTTTLEEGKADMRITLQTVKKSASASGQFELPPGLKKKDMPISKMPK